MAIAFQYLRRLNSMKLRKYFLGFFLSFLAGLAPFNVAPASAHGGGLDSDGGHNCNVGSCAGTYHCHQARGPRCSSGGSTGSSGSTRSSTSVIPSLCISSSGASLSRGDIARIQASLVAKGFSPGPIDGVLGRKTKNAISQYQFRMRLSKTYSTQKSVLLPTIRSLGIRSC